MVTWAQTKDFVPSGGPVSAGAAGSQLAGSGYYDLSGSVWSINSSNQLISATVSSPWNNGVLLRSGDVAQSDCRIRETFVYSASGTSPWTMLRCSGAAGALSGYIVNVNGGTAFQLGTVVGGTLTLSSATFNSHTALTTGTTYVFDASVVQTNSTTTTISATLYASDGATLVWATETKTDTTFALQNVAGRIGVFQYASSSTPDPITELVSFSDTGTTTTLPVSSAAALFSPGNWKGDTGRGGSVYRQSWNNGAWFVWSWTASNSPVATLLLNGPSASNKVSVFLNGVLNDNISIAGGINLATLAGFVSGGANVARIYLRNSTQATRWGQAAGGGNTVTVQGLQLDTGSTAGTAPAPRPWVLVVGDSITEGIQSNGGSDDFLDGYSYNLLTALDAAGYDTCISACGYSGYLHTGDSPADVPAYYYVSSGTYSASSSRWSLIDSGVSLLDANGQLSSYGATGTPPAAVFIAYGANEILNSMSTSDLQTAVTGCIKALRGAAPAAKFVIAMPFAVGGGFQPTVGWGSSAPSYRTALLNGVSAAADPGTSTVDIGASLAAQLYSGVSTNPFINGPTGANVHPILAGHALATGPIAVGVLGALKAVAPGFRQGLFH